MSDLVRQMKKFEDFISMPMGASDNDVKAAEKELGLTFAEEYKDYTKEAGAVSADGHEFTGVVNSARLNVVTATERAKEKNLNIPDGLYLVEDLNVDGILIWQDRDGVVYESAHGHAPEKIARSLKDYLRL